MFCLFTAVFLITNHINQRVGFAANGRPADISWWIKSARAERVVVKDPVKFKQQWVQWWIKINPEWRTRNVGKLTIGGKGDWSPMWISGTNGFINVIAGLVALKEIYTVEEWAGEMRDIAWVIQQARAQKMGTLYVMLRIVVSDAS